MFPKIGHCNMVCLWLLVCSFALSAQDDIDHRIFDWSQAGLNSEIINNKHFIDFESAFASADQFTNPSTFLQGLVDDAKAKTIIYFREGNYFFDQSILLKSNISIVGATSDNTFFSFDLNGKDHCFLLQGTASADLGKIQGSINAKDSNVEVSNVTDFEEGMHLLLKPEDAHLVSSNWALGSTGQLVTVKEIVDNRLFFNEEIRRDYEALADVSLIEILPIENVFLSGFSLERKDETPAQTSNILIKEAFNCQVSCIESIKCNFAHISISFSQHIEIRSSKFHDAHSFGGGGEGYGVVMQYASSDCLLMNSTFENLRHSILLQAGANGNVVGYNYSLNPYWDQPLGWTDTSGDLVLHGNYPYSNLFEGNIVQNIVVDQSHGINGPLNTFFRNRAEGYGFYSAVFTPTDKLNLIGNEIANIELGQGLFLLNGDDHFLFANNIKGFVLFDEWFKLNRSSLFIEENPFDENAVSWPPIAFPNQFNNSDNLSKLRYTHNENLCVDHSLDPPENEGEIQSMIFPNPNNGVFTYTNLNEDRLLVVELFTMQGIKLLSQPCFQSKFIEVTDLPTGMYFLCVSFESELVETKKVLINNF